MSDWYDEYVEPGVRSLVRELRSHGINTVSSCHHEMSVTCGYVVDGTIQIIHNLVYNHLMEVGEKIDFTLTMTHQVENGYVVSTSVTITLPSRVPVPRDVDGEVAH